MNEFFGWFATAWAAVGGFIDDYGDQVVIGAGSVGMLFALVAIRKFVKNNEHDEVAANLGVFLFLVVTTEGMWEVVRHKLNVDPWLAVSMFAAFDVVIYAQGKSAIRKLTADSGARIGSHLAIIWALSVAASVTVSFASGNAATWSFRFFAPLVGAALWTQKVLELRKQGAERQESNWIWTPTRLMVRWGWMKPGAADDLTEVLRKRTVEQIVDAAVVVWLARPVDGVAPDPKVVEKAGKAAQRLQALAKTADPQTVAAARAQLRIAVGIQDELFAGLGQAVDKVDDDTRDVLDEVKLITRAATTRLRSEHRGLLHAGHDGDHLWANPVVRMPGHIAGQIAANSMANGVATRPATTNGHQSDNLMAMAVATEAVPSANNLTTEPGQPDDQTDGQRSGQRSGQKQTDNASRIRRIAGRMKNATDAQIAERAGVSVSTVRRALGKKEK